MLPRPESERDISLSLKQWIELNITRFLANLDLPVGDQWELPVVEDYVLVVAVKDYKDGGVGVFSITDPESPGYRIQGLLETALNNGS